MIEMEVMEGRQKPHYEYELKTVLGEVTASLRTENLTSVYKQWVKADGRMSLLPECN